MKSLILALIFVCLSRDALSCPWSHCLCEVSGETYQGRIHKTKKGKTCQAWNTNSPHKPNENALKQLIDGNADDAKNYCRNPDGEPGPWCYTTDPDERWDFCDIPLCEPICRDCLTDCDPTGKYYRGKERVTQGGFTCQAWHENEPNSPNQRVLDNLIDRYIHDAKNYCRNPDGEPRPWCYTTDPDKRFDLCALPTCPEQCSNGFNLREYRGTTSVTLSGKTCLHWNDLPEDWMKCLINNRNFSDGSVNWAKNYCRTPLPWDWRGTVVPWCFTDGPNGRKEKCALKVCS